MTKEEALNILRPEGNHLDALIQAFRAKAKQWHPDMNPGNEAEATEVMKTVNQAYDMLKDSFGDWFAFTNPEYHDQGLDERLFEILQKIKYLPGLKMEVCGTWIWVTGDTKPVKEILKEHKFRFAPKKKSWYWRSEGYRRGGGKGWSMDKIRSRYGSKDIQGEESRKVA